jgi:hypothetical protein
VCDVIPPKSGSLGAKWTKGNRDKSRGRVRPLCGQCAVPHAPEGFHRHRQRETRQGQSKHDPLELLEAIDRIARCRSRSGSESGNNGTGEQVGIWQIEVLVNAALGVKVWSRRKGQHHRHGVLSNGTDVVKPSESLTEMEVKPSLFSLDFFGGTQRCSVHITNRKRHVPGNEGRGRGKRWATHDGSVAPDPRPVHAFSTAQMASRQRGTRRR